MRLFPLNVAAATGPSYNPHHLLEPSSHEKPSAEQRLADRLHCRLLDLDFPAFAFCVCRLLEALGYQDVHLAGRREWKGYNKPGGGGYDLEATLPGSLSSRRIIAQIKQFDGLRVHQRSVDELRGACLRVGAAEALLITTSAFSKVARAGAAAPGGAGSPVAPVRLMDGDELAALLIRHQIGVKRHTGDVKGRGPASLPRRLNEVSRVKKRADEEPGDEPWEVDDAFFAEVALAGAILSKASPTERQSPTPPQSPTQSQNPVPVQDTTPIRDTTPMQDLTQWRVTVRISSKLRREEQEKGIRQKGGEGSRQKGGG